MQPKQNQNHRLEHEPFFTEGTIEVRSVEGGKTVVYGYAALFNVRSRVLTTSKGVQFVEEIKPGAFDNTDFSDLVCFFNHEGRDFLASEPNLRYGTDQRGLWYEYDHDPQDPTHVSALRRIQRRDAKGSSFQFPPLPLDCCTITRIEGDMPLRTITRFPVVAELGPVITPAYRGTTTHVRGLGIDDIDIPTESRDMTGAYNTNTNPTPAQKEAGNYKKGRVRVAGMEMSIENPIGSVRSGKSADGTPWENTMQAHYGYILGSKAGDGDNLDVFLTSDADTARVVWVIDQINPDGTFDEHKCVIGPASEQDARALYLAHYSEGWTGLGAICCIPMEVFRAWAMDGTTKRRPLMLDQNAGKLYGPYLDAMRTVLEAGGTAMEEQRNAGGTPVESGGIPLERRGTAAESAKNAGGKVAEAGGKVAEAGKKIEEAGENIEEAEGKPPTENEAEKAAKIAAEALQEVEKVQAKAYDAINAAKAATAEGVAKKGGIDPNEALLQQRKIQVRQTLL